MKKLSSFELLFVIGICTVVKNRPNALFRWELVFTSTYCRKYTRIDWRECCSKISHIFTSLMKNGNCNGAYEMQTWLWYCIYIMLFFIKYAPNTDMTESMRNKQKIIKNAFLKHLLKSLITNYFLDTYEQFHEKARILPLNH